MLTDAEKTAIRESWRLMAPVFDTAAELLVERLAREVPELSAAPERELQALRQELLAMLGFAVRALDWESSAWRVDVADEDDLFMTALAWGRRDPPLVRLIGDSYSAVGDALLSTLGYVLGQAFDAETRAAWSRLYTLLANALRMGRLSASQAVDTHDPLRRYVPAPRGAP